MKEITAENNVNITAIQASLDIDLSFPRHLTNGTLSDYILAGFKKGYGFASV